MLADRRPTVDRRYVIRGELRLELGLPGGCRPVAIHAQPVHQHIELIEQSLTAAMNVFCFGDEPKVLVGVDVAAD